MILNVFRGALAFALAGVVVLLIVAAGFTQPAAGPPEAVKVPDVPRKVEQPEPITLAGQIRKMLNEPTDKLRQGIDPGQTLKDVLEFLGRSHGFSFRVDANAFKQQGADSIEEKQLPRGLPATRAIALGTLLQDLLNQLEPVQGTYIVRRNYIEIVPVNNLFESLSRELVMVDFSKRPLAEALKELSELTGASIVLDAKRAGERGSVSITGAFHHTPLAMTVALLANMAELEAILVGNIFYVTSPDNAAKLIQQGLAAPATGGPAAGGA